MRRGSHTKWVMGLGIGLRDGAHRLAARRAASSAPATSPPAAVAAPARCACRCRSTRRTRARRARSSWGTPRTRTSPWRASCVECLPIFLPQVRVVTAAASGTVVTWWAMPWITEGGDSRKWLQSQTGSSWGHDGQGRRRMSKRHHDLDMSMLANLPRQHLSSRRHLQSQQHFCDHYHCTQPHKRWSRTSVGGSPVQRAPLAGAAAHVARHDAGAHALAARRHV